MNRPRDSRPAGHPAAHRARPVRRTARRRRPWRAELSYQLQRAAGTALILAGLELASAHLSS